MGRNYRRCLRLAPLHGHLCPLGCSTVSYLLAVKAAANGKVLANIVSRQQKQGVTGVAPCRCEIIEWLAKPFVDQLHFCSLSTLGTVGHTTSSISVASTLLKSHLLIGLLMQLSHSYRFWNGIEAIGQNCFFTIQLIGHSTYTQSYWIAYVIRL